MRAPGGTFISARTERTPVTRSITQPISAPASASIQVSENSGQRALISMPPGSPNCSHRVSVMKGLTGCSSFRHWASTQAAMARVSAFASSSVPLRIGLASSTYQSQKMFQMKR